MSPVSPFVASSTFPRLVAAALCAALTVGAFPERSALAQDAPVPVTVPSSIAPYDEVTLKNGGMLRGTIVSIEPGKEVVILVQGTGEQRHVPFADVANVERGKGGLVSAIGPGGLLPPPLPPPTTPVLGAPRIHIASDHQITLHGDDPDAPTYFGRYRPIACVSPCDQIVDGRTGQRFYFAGDEIPRSDSFRLDEKSGDVRVSVSAGSYTVRSLGTGGIILGSVGLGAGGTLLLIGAVTNSANEPDPHTPRSLRGKPDRTGQDLVTISEAMLIGGGVVLATGIVMSIVGQTRYDFQTAAAEGGVVRF